MNGATFGSLVKVGLAVFGGLAISTAALAQMGGGRPESGPATVEEGDPTTFDDLESASDEEVTEDEAPGEEAGPDEQASDVAHAVWGVKSGWEGERGCEFGMAVSAAARGANGEEGGPAGDPCAKGAEGRNDGAQGRAQGEAASAEGREKARENRERARERADQAGRPAEAEQEAEAEDD